MPIDISAIKKLTVEEKLQLIDELWDSINREESASEPPEIISLLEERMASYNAGQMSTCSPEEAMVLLKKNLEEYRKNAGV